MKIVKIGRGSSNDVMINDGYVSHAHCQIIQENDGSFTLIDVGSSNGTYINGVQRHGQVKLNKNDIVRIGNTTLPWQSYFSGGNSTSLPPTGTVIDGGKGYIHPVPPRPSIKPDNYLVWAILGTIFCCLPFGIVSIVYASKVDGLWAAGDYYGAEEAARKAKTWFWWCFSIGLIISLFYIAYYVLVGVDLGL